MPRNLALLEHQGEHPNALFMCRFNPEQLSGAFPLHCAWCSQNGGAKPRRGWTLDNLHKIDAAFTASDNISAAAEAFLDHFGDDERAKTQWCADKFSRINAFLKDSIIRPVVVPTPVGQPSMMDLERGRALHDTRLDRVMIHVKFSLESDSFAPSYFCRT